MLIPCLIVAIVFHEFAHGYSALLLGDTTARDAQRLSLNPIRHVDPVGTLLVPGALAMLGAPVFGWAKPVPVRQDRLDNPRFGMMAVAAAGPGSNFVLALIGAIALGLFLPAGAQITSSGSEMSLIADGAGETLLVQSERIDELEEIARRQEALIKELRLALYGRKLSTPTVISSKVPK